MGHRTIYYRKPVEDGQDCQDHRPVQHRDGKPPWCKTCGLTAYGVEPVGLFDRERRR